MLGSLFYLTNLGLIGINMTSQTVNILCRCGSNKFEIPRNPKASDVITCANAELKKNMEYSIKK
jgi:hypothetical protein